MSKLADIAFEKIDRLGKDLMAAKAALFEREAQLNEAINALENAKEQARMGNPAAADEIATTALARLSSSAASLLQETKERIRKQTAQECVSLIYPDGNPEIAIRRIKQDFGLSDITGPVIK